MQEVKMLTKMLCAVVPFSQAAIANNKQTKHKK